MALRILFISSALLLSSCGTSSTPALSPTPTAVEKVNAFIARCQFQGIIINCPTI